MLDSSDFIARLIGPLLLVNTIAILVNRKGFQEVIAGSARNPAIVYLSGMLTLLPGLMILQVHNFWVADWPVLITIFGWLATIGGVARMVFPDRLAMLGSRMLARPGLLFGSAAVSAALGTILTLKGYQPVG